MLRLILFAARIALLGATGEAWAHSGGLNGEGCHRERATGGYHCHRATATTPPPRQFRSAVVPEGANYYPNCAAARAAGAAPLRRGDPGYRAQLDGDGDGVACEWRGGSGGSKASVAPAAPGAAAGLMGRSEVTLGGQEPIIGTATALDGDTLTLNGQRTRLFGVDAFEAEQRCSGTNGRAWGCGGVATRALQALVADASTVWFPRDTDTYQRTVAICRSGGTDLAAAMVVRGLAVAYARYSSDYDAEQALANKSAAGAWSGTFVDPETYRRTASGSATARAARLAPDGGECLIKGNIDSGGRKLYHMPSDPSYEAVQPEAMFCSEEEAMTAGFARPRGS